jgi:lipid-A-disaccharide synthase-like uncharacterized protein
VVADPPPPPRAARGGDRLMLIRLSQDIGLYFYDVFVARFDFWLVFGMVAQLVFGARFIVQWIVSERAGKSVMPLAFWFLSVAGGLMTLAYGLVRREPVIIFGQALSTIIYVRNLMLIFREKRELEQLSHDGRATTPS